MVACNHSFFSDQESGASMMEVLLALAIVALAAPFVYKQIANTNQTIYDISRANGIIKLREPVLNFVRMNQDRWPDVAQIKLSDEELDSISELPSSAFIDKYSVRGATVTDVYLAFDLGETNLRSAQIAHHIGIDAAVVGADGVAYGASWAVAAPDFKPGNLIYRVSRDFAGVDKSKFLHRGSSGEDDLNVMFRDLNMGGFNALDVGTVTASSAKIKNASATFVDIADAVAQNVYFSSGANMDGGRVSIGALRVTGDISGFRNIYADTMNGRGFTTSGRVITDRATVTNSVNVARDFVLKSDTTRTVSGFSGITANSVAAPYITTEEIIFYENFGLTISGELLMSTNAPLKIGSWAFPSTTPPRFSVLDLSRATIPDAPSKNEFGPLLLSGWQSIPPKSEVSPQ